MEQKNPERTARDFENQLSTEVYFAAAYRLLTSSQLTKFQNAAM
jgi:hypothetical protein